MEFKGKKGKWFIDEKYTSIIDENKNPIVSFYGVAKSIYIKDEIESKANSLLITKAPEMLEMLKEVIEFTKKVQAPSTSALFLRQDIEQLIKEATEL